MVDLTTYGLEELQEKVTKTLNGNSVRIYANDGEVRCPIHTAVCKDVGLGAHWGACSFPKEGTGLDLSTLVPHQRLDFSALPEGTLVNVRGWGLRHICTTHKAPVVPGKVAMFPDGKLRGKSITHFVDWCELVKGDAVPWFGGKQPVPDCVEVKLWFRNGATLVTYANLCPWEHSKGDSWLYPRQEIVAFQITGKLQEGYAGGSL